MDDLDLIAEARRRQEAAERDRDFHKVRADRAYRRLRAVIAAALQRPVKVPEGGEVVDWEDAHDMMREFVTIVRDPYADHDSDEYGMTSGTMIYLLTWRFQQYVHETALAMVAARDNSEA